MFVEPDSIEPKGAVKADPTATARSTIRRQRTVRYSPTARMNHQSGNSQNPRQRNQSNRGGSPGLDRSTLLEDIRRRGRDSVQQTSHRSRRNGLEDAGAAAVEQSHLDGNVMHTAGGQATHRSRVEVEVMQEARNRAWTESQGRQPAVPQESGRLADPHSRHTQTRSSAPQLESNLVYGADISPEPLSGRPSHRSARRAAFTPGFAPARRLGPISSDLAYSQRVVDIASLSNQIRDLQSLPQDREDAFGLSAMLWELHSMLARTRTDLSSEYLGNESDWIEVIRGEVESIRCRSNTVPRSTGLGADAVSDESAVQRLRDRTDASRLLQDDSDGLGDRRRSLSPELVSWETMLTTITPDDQVPSTHSSFASTGAPISAAASFADSHSTAPSSAQDVEPCPVDSNGEPTSDSEDRAWDAELPRNISHSPDLDASFSQVDGHLDRIESLSRRLRHQRSQGEFIARHRRIVEREAELQRLEITLQRLERQLEDEREIGTNAWERPTDSRASRGRL